jgi:hypothetical protein
MIGEVVGVGGDVALRADDVRCLLVVREPLAPSILVYNVIKNLEAVREIFETWLTPQA